jgi:hypothetical protein
MNDFRALCAELVDALQYHREQTRPIKRTTEILTRARAALSQPEPQGPTDEELLVWASYYGIDYVDISRPSELDGERAPVRSDELCIFARTILTSFGRPAIEPVPVAERLPGPEDCDAEGRSWFGGKRGIWMLMTSKYAMADSFWLPTHALPVPQP